MADFLEDYSNLAAAGGAFKGFAEGFEKAQDSKAKRQEQEARAKAENAKAEREAFEHSLSQRKQKQIMDSAAHGQEPDFDPVSGEVTGTHYKPEYIDMQKEKANADPFGLKGTKAQRDKAELDKTITEQREKVRKRNASVVPGYVKSDDYNADPVDERKIKVGYQDIKNFNGILDSLKTRVEGADPRELANPYSNTAKSIKQDLRDLQLIYKSESFAKLGVLTGPDLSILEDVIENPGSISNLWSGKAGVLSRYEQLKNKVNTGFDGVASSYGLVRSPQPGLIGKPKGLVGGAPPPGADMSAKIQRLKELKAKAGQ